MKRLLIAALALLAPLAVVACDAPSTVTADQRQAAQQARSLDQADRMIGMPRITNFTQRKLLKNAYEDMDQTLLTWVYSQAIDGRFVCIGQAIGYGVSGGTQFTAGHKPEYHYNDHGGSLMLDQPEPNGLFVPSSAEATIIDLIDPKTGHAHTVPFEMKMATPPFQLPDSVVSIKCPPPVDPSKVVDVKETSTHTQRN